MIHLIPKPQARIAEQNGFPTSEWYDYLKQALEAAEGNVALQAEIAAAIARIEALEAGGTEATLQGLESVRIAGTLAGGLVQFRLQGDSQSPGPSLYYGTDENGVKGFYAIPAPTVSFNLITSDGDPFVTSDNDLLVVT